MLTWPIVRHTAGRYLGGLTDEQWAAQQVAPFPLSWAGRLLDRWRVRTGEDRAAGNAELLKRCGSLAGAHRAGLAADANDAQICQEADESARDMTRRLSIRDSISPATWPERVRELARWAEASWWLRQRGIDWPDRVRGPIRSALARVQDARWWRRMLRVIHARAVEGTARALGLVSKRAGCYVSDDGLHRRRGQAARNARALESVKAVNEHGQDYTLAELAAKGPANKAIRRHELMTRIAGFEVIAKECGHEAAFVTVTCPSRMHAVRTKPGGYGVEPNPAFDGTQPGEAQRHLSGCWARFRSAAERAGVELYGFRIAEPNHDGTPHWHALLFFPATIGAGKRAGRPVAIRVLVGLLRRYFLWQQDPGERGARKHRVKVERIDWSRGSAAGYVAKYVAKNIDGMHVERDLYGNPAMESSARVEAWAATWRIRQFQQIGGAPVGIWRELRRLHPEQAEGGEALAGMLEAVNVTAQARQHETEAVRRYTAAHGWATYLHLQGGHRVPRRSLRLQLLREQAGELGRYGEPLPPRPVGVVTVDQRREVVQPFGAVLRPFKVDRTVIVEAESERCSWIVVPEGNVAQVRQRLQEAPAARAARRPWSPVNNCTAPTPAPLFGPAVERYRKRGRWADWSRGGGKTPERGAHGTHDERSGDDAAPW